MFGYKKFEKMTIQLLDESIEQLMEKYFNTVANEATNFERDFDQTRRDYYNEVHDLALDKATALGGDIAERINYLRQVTCENDFDVKTVGFAYMFIMNALTGRKAKHKEAMQGRALDSKFLLTFKDMADEAIKFAYDNIENPELGFVVKSYYNAKLEIKELPCVQEILDGYNSGKFSELERDIILETRKDLENTIADCERVIDINKQKLQCAPEETKETQIPEEEYAMAVAFVSEEIPIVNEFFEVDLGERELEYSSLLSIIHGIVCFYVFLASDNQNLLTACDSLANNSFVQLGLDDKERNSLMETSTKVYNNLHTLGAKLIASNDNVTCDQLFVGCSGVLLTQTLQCNELEMLVDFKMMALYTRLENHFNAKEEQISPEDVCSSPQINLEQLN